MDGVETRYVLDGLNVLEERDGSNAVTAVNLHAGLDQLLMRQDYATGSVQWAHTDHLGSVEALTDATGQVVERYRYSSFGQVSVLGADFSPKSSAPRIPFTYTAREWEPEVGLYFYGARFMDPRLGRWLSRDPLENAELSQGPNLYAYVANNPVIGVDPLGLWNLWNPLTWGLDSISGENPWNPFDSSAEWGATIEGSKMGAAAYIDGINPFGNFYQDLGVYDPCKDKGTSASRWLGKYVGREALLAAAGAGVASKFSGPLSRLPLVGKGGSLFGRGGRFGAKGVFNSGDVRLGWGWNGARDVFRASWSTPGNRSWWNHFDIF